MKYLAIDTSTSYASVALSVGTDYAELHQHNIREHAKHLLPMVSELLANAALTVSQLDGIIFGRGPGSFTGLRVACSVVKGLAYPYDLPVFPVSCLAAIVEEVRYHHRDANEDAGILAMIDARMHEVYWSYVPKDASIENEFLSDPSHVMVAENIPIMMAGVGYETYLEKFSPSIREQTRAQLIVYPEACAMIRLVKMGQCTPVSANEALPVYIRDNVVQK